ncbi:MAG: hypothetical protein KDI98_07775, partial [Hyphomicrobiaceae bacterium]|nr:hypothetical protein [Hyphomicrobiaceae bacterium]
NVNATGFGTGSAPIAQAGHRLRAAGQSFRGRNEPLFSGIRAGFPGWKQHSVMPASPITGHTITPAESGNPGLSNRLRA